MHINKASRNKIKVSKNNTHKKNNKNSRTKMMMINFIRKVNITSVDFAINFQFISQTILSV